MAAPTIPVSTKENLRDSIDIKVDIIHPKPVAAEAIEKITHNRERQTRPQLLTPGTLSLGLVLNPPFPTPYVPPTKKDRDILFQSMLDEYFNPPPSAASPIPAVVAPNPTDLTGTPSSITTDQNAPFTSTSQTPQETQSLVIPLGVKEYFHDIEVAHLDNDPFFGALIPEPNSKEYSSRNVIPTNVNSVNHPPEHLIN
uniref:Uncharacterized protein n=1 Tax=Tanacetum cinerariifolium TaxID=118510 RepID=A0A6L2KTS6_TANCI|nr:hypothetical protein [Tanacetum cinerariifolium]